MKNLTQRKILSRKDAKFGLPQPLQGRGEKVNIEFTSTFPSLGGECGGAPLRLRDFA